VKSRKYWIDAESDLMRLDLGDRLIDDLRSFWHDNTDTLISRTGSTQGFRREDEVYVIAERLVERRSLLIFGAGHVGYSIARMGLILGSDVTLLDDREDFLEKAKQGDPAIHTLLIDFGNIAESMRKANLPAVVIVTRGHQCDEVILKQVADYTVSYIGMIGSKRRVESIFKRLREQGINDSFLRQVKAPIGLEIGAKTPQEIAVSVHAEIIKHCNGADVQKS